MKNCLNLQKQITQTAKQICLQCLWKCHSLSLMDFLAMINMHSWMFISSYEKLRAKLLNSKDIVSMIHLGSRAFKK